MGLCTRTLQLDSIDEWEGRVLDIAKRINAATHDEISKTNKRVEETNKKVEETNNTINKLNEMMVKLLEHQGLNLDEGNGGDGDENQQVEGQDACLMEEKNGNIDESQC